MAKKTNCTINGHEYYKIQRKIGEDEKGKAITKTFYGSCKREAELAYEKYKGNKDNGIESNEYFAKVIDYYMTSVFANGKHSPGTKNRYDIVYRNRIKESRLREYRMNTITGKALQDYFNGLVDDGVTHSTLVATKNVLRLFFRYAQIEGYCRDITGSITIPQSENYEEEIVVFSEQDINKILHSDKRNKNAEDSFIFKFALGTGLRQGEILGLTYKDITDKSVKVQRQAITDTNKSRILSRTKTKSSVRIVPMPVPIQELFRQYKARQKNTKDDDLVFPAKTGNIMDKSNLIRSYRRFLETIGVEYKEFHTLRRTFCTQLAKEGVPLAVASRLMGHDSIETTAKYYTHITDDEKEEAIKKIENLFKKDDDDEDKN